MQAEIKAAFIPCEASEQALCDAIRAVEQISPLDGSWYFFQRGLAVRADVINILNGRSADRCIRIEHARCSVLED